MKPWKDLFAPLVDLLIPSACLACGARIDDQQQVICENCEAKLSLMGNNTCPVCGSELTQNGCEVCLEEDFAFDKAQSLFRYSSPVKELIHTLKYNGYLSPAGYFALPLAELIEADDSLQGYDYLCAVPLHPVRERERGYNQSDLIAYSLSVLSGLPYINPVFRRVNTLSQTTLDKAHRAKNLSGAFTVPNHSMVQGKKIIVVDDVFTTGTTINEIAGVLRQAGAIKICALTVARA
ncbi:MAG: ComF family protein [Candidatus Cloacimonas sp.]|nr:ComF family protein [Candidatus Cloacimonas sp.]